MKRILAGAGVCLLFGAVLWKLNVRLREERLDRQLMLLVDWSEVHDSAARLGLKDGVLLEKLHDAGANALLLGAATVQDYLLTDFRFPSRASTAEALQHFADRGISGLSLKSEAGKYRIISPREDWDRLKDVEAGFDPELIRDARQAGIRLILRVNHDPWLAKDRLFTELAGISAMEKIGVLLNSDEIPGGMEAFPQWRSFLKDQGNVQMLFEFHPAKSTMKLAYAVPSATWRAHTIPTNELRDLTPAQVQARWRRAVEERSCRFLLVHMSPTDSLNSFLTGLSSLRATFLSEGWVFAWPVPRPSWSFPSIVKRQLAPAAAFCLAILTPVLALRAGLRTKHAAAFILIVSLTFLGACATAALADNPLTRLEVMPFRGIRAAFVMAWFGSFLSLYSWNELKDQSLRPVRRLDIVAGLVVVGVVAYVLIRMGNASAAWKPGWEQTIRDHLEILLVARPRFKEFAVGYPLLLLGLHLRACARSKSFWQDGRFLIGFGMIGPISLMNTFCHLHSPLVLALWRSVNGIVLGTMLGLVLIAAKKRVVKFF
jgi:hypothetical protein